MLFCRLRSKREQSGKDTKPVLHAQPDAWHWHWPEQLFGHCQLMLADIEKGSGVNEGEDAELGDGRIET